MKHEEIDALMRGIAPAVREYVAKATAPLVTRLAEFEQRFAALPVPRDGKDADPDQVAGIVILRLNSQTTGLREELETRLSKLTEEVARIEALPVPQNRKDADPEKAALIALGVIEPEIEAVSGKLRELETSISSRLDAAVAALPKPQDGRSVTPEELVPLIAEQVSRAVSALPQAKDGEPGVPGAPGVDGVGIAHLAIDRNGELVVTLSNAEQKNLGKIIGQDGEDGIDGESGKDGIDGKDGLSIAGLVIDRQGELVVTMSNGEQRSLGCVIGRDGAPGAAGKDGLDGLGFEDMAAEYDGDRMVTLKFVRGEQIKSFPVCLPIAVYRGVYKSGEAYSTGDSVTFGGSQWIARRDTTDKPETTDAWTLAVKRGRDGKDGKDGAPGPQGVEGKAGRDLTQMTFGGERY